MAEKEKLQAKQMEFDKLQGEKGEFTKLQEKINLAKQKKYSTASCCYSAT